MRGPKGSDVGKAMIPVGRVTFGFRPNPLEAVGAHVEDPSRVSYETVVMTTV